MKTKNSTLALLLALITALSAPASMLARGQSGQDGAGSTGVAGKPNAPVSPEEGHGYVINMVNGNAVCRDATPAERVQILRRDPEVRTSHIHPMFDGFRAGESKSGASGLDTGTANLIPGHLDIVLRPTAQLQLPENAHVLAAFERAAAVWENLITSEMTVVIDVDYGTTRFGTEYPESVLGSTSGGVFYIPSYTALRNRLVSHATAGDESNIIAALPTSAGVPTDSGTLTQMDVGSPLARALGLIAPHANPADTTGNDRLGRAPSIGFNSKFNFDFDPANGISAGKSDFDAVVVHELGHVLGFNTEAGLLDVAPDQTLRPTVWDLFRFRPGTTVASFATAPRVLTTGGEHRYFDGVSDLGLSTGNPKGEGGDGEQASHWKDDHFGGGYVGIMDPTIPSGVRRQMTANDRRALDFMGYNLGAPPAGPDNDSFANAVTLQGATGSVTGTNVGATKESGEPQSVPGVTAGGRSVWYNWTSPVSGAATFDTVGSNFDTTIAAFTGSGVAALTLVAANDDINTNGGNVASSIQFNVTAGAAYRILVDGYDGDSGNVQLNWSASGTTPTPTPTPTVSYSVSGRVQDPAGNGVAGVRVAIDGPNLVNTFPHLPVTTDAGGNFQFSLLTPGGNYTVRSDDLRYAFAPASAVFNNISANHTGVTFTTSPLTVSVTGRVVEGATPLQGVLVGLYSGTTLLSHTLTGADGRWTFTGVAANQGYNTLFVKSGYSFTPPGLTFPVGQSPVDVGDVLAVKGNDIDASEFFVRQHYLDFLGREADSSGLAFWVNDIESCGLDLQCRQGKRVNVSAAFFLSIEFQNTGYLVERMYKTAYGDRTEASTGLVVPIVTRQEFVQDTPLISQNVIINVGVWQAQLEANKSSYALAFVQRARFTDAFPASLTPAQFVARLNQNTGGALSQGQVDVLAAELALNNTDAGRASVLRKVAESAELDAREKNRAYVLMQYFGYLRRNPSDAPEHDLNYAGWNFWLGKLDEFGGDAVRAEMVKAFLDSAEYRNRFGQ